MKDKLTKEQSAHLIELGVSSDRASSMELDIEDFYDRNFLLEYRPPLRIFTLTDVLELLPKEIYSEEREIPYFLSITMGEHGSRVCYRHPAYCKGFGPAKSKKELIDALYELLCWTIENKHYK